MTAPPYFPGQPGDPFDDPQIDLTLLELSDGYLALSQAAVAVDTDEAERVPGLLAIVDAVAYRFPANSPAAQSLSLGASWLTEHMPPAPREQADVICADGWDSVAAFVRRSSDEQIRARNPGIGDEGIARLRRDAAGPNPWRHGTGRVS